MTLAQNTYDDCLFQIIIIDQEKEIKLEDATDEEDFLKIVVGKLKDIKGYYEPYAKFSPDHCHIPNFFFDDYLPSPGVKIDDEFINQISMENLNLKRAESSSVRHLLQARKLSQLMNKAWLYDDNEDSEETNLSKFTNLPKYIGRIFHGFNFRPETFSLIVNKGSDEAPCYELKPLPFGSDLYSVVTTWENDPSCSQLTESDLKIKEIKSDEKNDEAIDHEARNDEQEKISRYYLENRNALILELLLSGQAYIIDKDKKTLQRLHEPIFSTHELIWHIELSLSWDSYYAKTQENACPGFRRIKNIPQIRLYLGFPPRPGYWDGKVSKIDKWVNAKEKSDDIEQDPFPFYPPKGSSDWENLKLWYVFPPYP
ncbi:MAG: hypothetical protein MGG11_20800 [Trichodesmium sp. MAG_R03]|nr:hypothetical protein [Trichodesmium sp. MAG_R03]